MVSRQLKYYRAKLLAREIEEMAHSALVRVNECKAPVDYERSILHD